jgi:putative exporter of polyketide antibiotics
MTSEETFAFLGRLHLVTVTFLWQLVGSLLGAPSWLAHLTPFAHVGLVPTQSFRLGAAAVMLAIGAVSALAAIASSGAAICSGREPRAPRSIPV